MQWDALPLTIAAKGVMFDLTLPAASGCQCGDVGLDGQLWL